MPEYTQTNNWHSIIKTPVEDFIFLAYRSVCPFFSTIYNNKCKWYDWYDHITSLEEYLTPEETTSPSMVLNINRATTNQNKI